MDKQAVINFVSKDSMETTVKKFNENEDIEYCYFERAIGEDVYRLIIDYNK